VPVVQHHVLLLLLLLLLLLFCLEDVDLVLERLPYLADFLVGESAAGLALALIFVPLMKTSSQFKIPFLAALTDN
jgi:hypothetical protein